MFRQCLKFSQSGLQNKLFQSVNLLKYNPCQQFANTFNLSDLTIGVPKESFKNERRVAMTPEAAQRLIKQGFKIQVEKNAGSLADINDEKYQAAGAKIVDTADKALKSDIIMKVRPPTPQEIEKMKPGAISISTLYPAQNKDLVQKLLDRKITSFAMDQIPRISRAQVFDVLSSMANISGYKAIIEAASHFGRFFTGQMTAAGRFPPAKIMIIGAGVAGLSAIATAKSMGAVVRCFDTRAACREQVQSLGAEFLEVKLKEDGEGAGGYGKEMSKEFIEAEMKLFLDQCKEVDIIVTTALIPGKPAPKLLKEYHVKAMKKGSVIVDLASETGGNCELTVPGQLAEKHGVKIIGYTDMASRLPGQSSGLYTNNLTKFLQSMVTKDNK